MQYPAKFIQEEALISEAAVLGLHWLPSVLYVYRVGSRKHGRLFVLSTIPLTKPIYNTAILAKMHWQCDASLAIAGFVMCSKIGGCKIL